MVDRVSNVCSPVYIDRVMNTSLYPVNYCEVKGKTRRGGVLVIEVTRLLRYMYKCIMTVIEVSHFMHASLHFSFYTVQT